MYEFDIQEQDLKLVDIYRDMLPKKLFDAHMHLYEKETVPTLFGNAVNKYDVCTTAEYLKDTAPFYPGVERVRLNTIPMPDQALAYDAKGLQERMNAHVLRDQKNNPQNVTTGFIIPSDTEETISRIASDASVRALKCYYFAYEGAPRLGNDTKISDYLPEGAFAVSAKKDIPIILHMMRNALDDESNMDYIKTMSKKYPDSKLLLAHCARSFASYTAVKRLPELLDLDNIWIDISAINDPTSMIASLKYNKKKTLFGTDYPVCMNRGRCFPYSDGFIWLINELVPSGYRPARMLAEELLAIYQTALLMDLDATEIEDLFYNNAMNLFKVEE